jgi:hypothetical protein
MKELFVDRNFSAGSVRMIELVQGILNEYARQGYRLSLRQLYYQMVARDYIENTQRSYKNMGNLVSNARLAGLIDWDMIEDRNRETVSVSHWDSPADIIYSAAKQFRIDKWQGQDWHVEVMVEKDALSGVLEPVCRELDVSITANKGYCSSSTMYEIAKRLADKWEREEKWIRVLYLGDHDPSGIDMTRDITDRLCMFTGFKNGLELDVVRLALNWEQIEQWRPPENPAKETDARFAAYVKEFGSSSWELDAVEPVTLARLVREAVQFVRDDDKWDEMIEKENAMRESLLGYARSYWQEHGDE